MSELAVDYRNGGRVIDLRRDPDAVGQLPRGRADGRYRCCACGAPLILTGPANETSRFTPRFRHAGGRDGRDYCSAPALHQADVQADLTRVLDLRDRLAALPSSSVWLQIDPSHLGHSWQLPPALVMQRGQETAVIERPRRPLTSACAERRLQAMRTQYGSQVQHWWLFDQDDPVHCAAAGALTVRIRGQEATHLKVHPTPAQRKLAAHGAGVYWLTGDSLLIPYGGRPHLHQPFDGEDWSGEMASWRRDWRISHPQPAGDAAWWGLVPLPITAWTRHQNLRPAAAFAVMTDLAAAEQGRERYRRQQARNHAHDNTPSPSHPTPPAPSQQASTTTPASQIAAVQSAPQQTIGHDTPPATLLTTAPARRPRPQHTAPVRMRWSWRRLLHIRRR